MAFPLMRYLSIFSGIEAASVAWNPLGWQPVAFSEIEPFPCAVLAHHYPDVQNFGDVTNFKEWPDAVIDLLVGGSPCQSFSVAGFGKGLDDPRGNLMLSYLRITERYRPRWLVWENVPGVLSSNGGRDFGTLLGGMAELGYGFAYRILDAQYIRVESHARAVPQRRRRVFVIGYLGDWRPPAAVLFERESLRWHSPPRRKARENFATSFAGRTHCGGDIETSCNRGLIPDVASTLTTSNQRIDADTETFVVDQPYTLAIRGRAGENRLEFRQDGASNAVLTPSGGRCGIGVGAIAFDCKASGQNGFGVGDIASTIRRENGGGHQAVKYGAVVRRLTPRECERLQGFPDNYTCIPWRGRRAEQCHDRPRYKALGNSMAVPVMRWIGERIQLVEGITMDEDDSERRICER